MISFDFNKTISGLPDSGKKNLDIYFQPALTWAPESVALTAEQLKALKPEELDALKSKRVKGVAMLFLENKENSDKIAEQDFQEMVKILVRWVWAASGKSEEDAPTTAYLTELFEAFAVQLLRYSELHTFLGNNFNFRIQEYSGGAGGGTELEATVFPMFPHLHLTVGTTDQGSFSPETKILDAGKIGLLKDFSQQYKSRFDPEAQNTDTIEAAYLPEFIFTGYFRMLIRSGLQELINAAPKATLQDMLQAVSKAQYQNIAGMASTFLLNGFRIPAGIFDTDQGLYEATGQQFGFADARVVDTLFKTETGPDGKKVTIQVPDTYYRIELRNPAKIPYLKTQSGGAFTAITYRIDTEAKNSRTYPLFDLAQKLKTVEATDFPASLPEQIAFYIPQNMNFALRQVIEWKKSKSDTDQLLPLSSSLRTHVRAAATTPKIDLFNWPGSDHKQEKAVANAGFSWVSMIKFNVQRIPSAQNEGFLAHTYEITEASDDDLNILEEIFNFLSKNAESNPVDLYLAYIPGSETGGGGLVSLEPASGAPPIRIFRSNLSSNTATPVDSDFAATLSRGTDNKTPDTQFLQLIWEGCTVANGGYFLYIQHKDPAVDEKWFKQATSASVHLIIEFTNTADPIHKFNNAVLLANPVDAEKDLVLARSSATVPVLVIPPGHIGFRLSREIPATPAKDAKAEAAGLYHMLGFGLVHDSGFVPTQSGIPIGPTLWNDPHQKWLYERLIPAYSLRKNPPATTLPQLLPGKDNPYLGIPEQASLPVECWWQDIYGNKLRTTTPKPGGFPLRYTDPIIGLNQWPSVSEHFRFVKKDASAIALELVFFFDTNPYKESGETPEAKDAAAKRAEQRRKADLLTFQKIYYQLLQADITLSAVTTVDTGWTIGAADGLDRASLLHFVGEIYTYLSDLKKAPKPYEKSFSRKNSSVKPPDQFIFEIGVSFTISRQATFVHEDLRVRDANKKATLNVLEAHRDVLSNTAFLTPKIIPGTTSVRDFASDFEQAFPDLRLAVGEDRLKKKQATDIGRPYYAVQLGTARGISYDISEENPAYFAIPPLANTLHAGNVPLDNYAAWKTNAGDTFNPAIEEKQFDAIDLNVLAREFLVAVEDFLEPECLVQAMQLDQAKTEAILTAKSSLAQSISNSLDVILLEDRHTGNLQEAKNALKRELLVHLVKGYDIETAVQFEVAIKVGNTALTKDWAAPKALPRIRGAAVVKNVWLGEDPQNLTLANQENLDFNLSAGRIDLQKSTGTSTFTYLFDTKTPEKFASIHLELEFRVTEIEHTIESVPGIPEFQASNWLSLVLPENLNTYKITDALLTDADKRVDAESKTLAGFRNALDKLNASDRKNSQYAQQADFEASLKTILGATEYAKFKDTLRAFSKPVFAVTPAGVNQLTPELNTAIRNHTNFKTTLKSVRKSTLPGTEFLSLPELETALKTATGASGFDRFKDRLLKYMNPFYRIEGAMLQNLNALIDAGNTELGPVRDILISSKIKDFEFLSLSGLETGLRKELPTADYDAFKTQLLELARPVYKVEATALDRLELEAEVALTSLRLLQKALNEIQSGGPLFNKDFFARQELETALKKELGRLSYEKFKVLILKYAQPFFQITDARLDALDAHFRGKTDAAEFRAVGHALRAGALKGAKFFKPAEFETAVVDVIGQQHYDLFGETLRAFFNPFRITDGLLAGLHQETNVPDRDQFDIVLQEFDAGKLKNIDFVGLSDFEYALIDNLGTKFYGLFSDQLARFSAAFYRIAGTMLQGLEQKYANEKTDNSRLQAVLKKIRASALKDRLYVGLEDLERELENLLGAEDFLLFHNRAPLFTNSNYMGKSPVPIPLRDYPSPPSLIYQGAEVDESSRTDLEDIRQWEYTIIYEHEDIAQDSIDCIIQLNTLPALMEGSLARSAKAPARDLFQALVNFNELYPDLAKDLALLRKETLLDAGNEADQKPAKQAMLAFQTLVGEIAEAWKTWKPVVSVYKPETGDMHFEISEEPLPDVPGANGEPLKRKQGFIYPRGTILRSRLGADDPEPLLALPGYEQDGEPEWDNASVKKTFTFLEDPLDQTVFGDSLIPDRKFTIENLDVIEHQNAWASVWLSRNKILLAGHETNPKFIFQTPAVRFTNLVSPFITNDEPWDLATLHSPGDQAEDKPLLEHMQRLLELVAPDITGLDVNYEVRLSCRYAFALVMGTGLNVDLKSTLPLLMGLRLKPKATLASGEKLLAAYPKMLADEIDLWLRLNEPSPQNASLLFSVDLFSKVDPESLTSLPMLRIKQIELNLKNILAKN
ncbi:MAG: hypothetical protein IPM36_15855 [Lewinellaceae bacterium]|nr:hypothetical protein [Lewinellaceae bacterium]